MADTFTPNLRLRKLEVGAYNNAWASPLNEVVTEAEQAISGAVSVSVTGGNVTLTSANGSTDQSRKMQIYVTGAQAVTNRTVTVLDTPKLYLLINDSAKQVTFTRVSGGTTLIVAAGQCCLAFVTTAGVFEVPPLGSAVQNAIAMTPLTLTIGGAHALGDATVAMKYVVQGSLVFVKLTSFNSNDFSNAAFTLMNNAGNWPTELVPARQQTIPIVPTENTVIVPANLAISTAAATPWSLLKVSGAAWLATGTDDRTMHNLSFSYSLRNF
jgi:hypothetical protein